MPTTDEIEEKFWEALKSDMTMMLGVVAGGKCHLRPMTPQIEEDAKPIWFFTSNETEIASEAGGGGSAVATFTSDDNDLFATVHGRLSVRETAPPSRGFKIPMLRPGPRKARTIRT